MNGGIIGKMMKTGQKIALTGPEIIGQKFCFRYFKQEVRFVNLGLGESLFLENQLRFNEI